MIETFAPDSVRRMQTLDLTVGDTPWPYAKNHREAIDAHWKLASAANANFFNGTIHVITALEMDATHVRARFMATEFKNFLYWRDEGFPAEAGVRDGFGSALIRSREGHVILGRQRPGNINEGLAYLPGGFIDARDVGANGRIDIYASVARELREETGLGDGDLTRGDGILLVEAGAHVALAIPYVSRLGSAELRARIAAFITADPDPELAEAIVVTAVEDLEGLPMPHYARVLLTSPLVWQDV